MKILHKSILILITSLTFFNCAKDLNEVPNDIIVHDFVWKGLNAYYLYQDQIPDLADNRFNSDQEVNTYLYSFPGHKELFSSLLTEKDITSTLIEDYSTITDTPLRTAFTNGLEFGIIAEPGSEKNVIGYVLHILPNSNAATKNIARGEFFRAVNGVQLTRDNYINILINGEDNFNLEMIDFDGLNTTPNAKIIALEKQSYNYPPTFLEKMLTVTTNNIAYLMYNNDFSANYINDINTTFLNFKNQSANKLILDLRYNIGGGSFAKNISQIAAMLTGQFANEILIKKQWNVKAQSWFELNQPDSLVVKFPQKLNTNTSFNSLNLSDLYIILNGESFKGSSAIELLINSLKPYINIHIVGAQTLGNHTGSITLYHSEDYNYPLRNRTHTVALQPVVLKFLNKDNQTYENGFAPNSSLCPNEDPLNLGVLGELSDPILKKVINYILIGAEGTDINDCNPNNFEYLYNSIHSQRNIDSNVLINQNLPNTN